MRQSNVESGYKREIRVVDESGTYHQSQQATSPLSGYYSIPASWQMRLSSGISSQQIGEGWGFAGLAGVAGVPSQQPHGTGWLRLRRVRGTSWTLSRGYRVQSTPIGSMEERWQSQRFLRGGLRVQRQVWRGWWWMACVCCVLAALTCCFWLVGCACWCYGWFGCTAQQQQHQLSL
ncbi:hypothetical protein CLOM_g1146 [Closterium sp. NIES-68]|nr:hypothetical protein CLOM_g1146 [Closterium sp. NIES-68]GJP77680.1 hypothetical protein CLOP_g8037 [Closterium sp. NIES-67]